MDKGISFTDVNIPETTYENYIEDRLEYEFTIPDYQASARKIVQCGASAIVMNKSVAQESVTLDGICVWRFVYLSEEDDILHSLSCEKPFSETFSVKAGEGTVRYKIKTQNTICKLQSPQRATCKTMICVALQVNEGKDKKIVATAADGDIQLLKENRPMLRPVKETEKEFKVTGEIPIKKPDVFSVCKADAKVAVQEVKCFEDKLVLKGVCKSCVLLLNRQSCEAERIESETPFSQIIDAEGIGEDCIANVRCTVLETETSMLGEGSEQTVLVSSTIHAAVSVYCPREISVIKDAYHPVYDLELKSEHVDYYEALSAFTMDKRMTEKVYMRTADISILYYEIDSEIEKITAQDNVLLIDGKVRITFVYKQNDEIGVSEFSLPFHQDKTLDASFDKLKCEADIYVEDFSYIILSETEIEINCDCRVNLSMFVIHACDLLTDLQVTNSKHEQALNTPLVLYYGTQGENLWEIGKKYSVPISVLQENNDIGGDTLPEDKLLFISKH